MNCIIVMNKGVVEKIQIIKSDITANAYYEDLVRDMLGDDFEYIVGGFFSDMTYDKVNEYLAHFGKEILYHTNLKAI
jgi:hypothetical protein